MKKITLIIVGLLLFILPFKTFGNNGSIFWITIYTTIDGVPEQYDIDPQGGFQEFNMDEGGYLEVLVWQDGGSTPYTYAIWGYTTGYYDEISKNGNTQYFYLSNNNQRGQRYTVWVDDDEFDFKMIEQSTNDIIADFEANLVSGSTPLTVHFTDLSEGSPTSWQWDFDNDGTIDSEEPNPNWTYNEAGLYTVCLTVSDGINSNTECKSDYIDVQPFVSYVCNNLRQTNSKYPETDDLSQKVTEEFGNNYIVADWLDLLELSDIESWISCMNLTDGDRFMLTRNGEYIYGTNRQYFVAYLPDGTVPGGWLVHDQLADKLFLGSWYGLNSRILAKGESALQADFEANQVSGSTPLTVHFTDLSEGSPTSWQWDFDNDGTIDSEEPNPNWTYNEAGLYTVCLTVSDGINSNTECKSDYIDVQPFVSYVCNNLRQTNSKYPETDDLSQKVTEEFGNNYIVADWLDLLELSDIESWISCMNLTDGDRFMLTRNGEYIYGTNRQYFVAYIPDGNVPGGWLVHGQIANKLFLGSYYGLNYRILAKGESTLQADFEANKTSGTPPLTVQFTDQSTGNPTSWQWDFDGDETVYATEQNPVWVYESPGLYDVTLIVAWDGFLDTLTKSEYITVINPEPIIVEVSTDKFSYTQDEIIEISITAQNNTDSTITLEFSNSCQSSYLIDEIEYDRGYPNGYYLCTMAFEYLDIPANSTFTWVHNHSLVITPLGLGSHQLVGSVDTYPNIITSISISFEVLPLITLPTVSTTQVSEITKTTALSGGNVTDDGGADVTARGVCWNTTGIPTTSNSKTEDGTGTGAFNSNIIGLSCNTNYYVRAYATNSVGTAYGDEVEFTTLLDESYFETVWTTPFSPMNIYVTKATVDEMNMVAGDEIGVFDIDPEAGNEICVGSGVLVEELANGAYLTLIASMDDGIGSTNGFQSGNEMIFKLYSQTIGLVELVNTTFPYPGYDEVFTPLGTATVELEGVTVITQTLEFVEGWNLSSMRTLPEDMNMLSVVNPLIEAEQLVKVINQDGASVEHLPFPPPAGQWSNTIGDWVIEQGYYVKVNENTSLSITAPPVEIPLEIPLRAGWNMTGMPCEYPQSTEEILQPLINAGILIKAINDQGQAIEHLPFPPPSGQWVYGFGAFEPGEGYYIKTSEASSLNFDCLSPYESDALIQKAQLQFFEPVYKNNPYMPMSVVLTGIDNLTMGDEIAIYDNGACVGAGVIEDFDFISFPVSMDDPLTDELDGYITGNQLEAVVWQNHSNTISKGDLLYVSGVETFQPLETFVGELNVLLTGIKLFEPVSTAFEVAPNPFSTSTWLNYAVPENGDITITIYNMAGQQESVLNNKQLPAGNGKIRIDGSSLIPGSYIMQINYSNQKGISTLNKKLFIN